MPLLFQFFRIAAITFAGELLSLLLPLPVPGSIYGLLLLLVLLLTGLLKLRQIERAADFLLQIMPVLFIGPCVSLLPAMGIVADNLVAILAICLVTSLLVMAVTGLTAQWMLRRKEETTRD